MNSKINNGTIAEMIVTTELLKHGYSVSLPVNHDSRYDMIFDTGNGLRTVQVKKAFLHSEGKKRKLYIETRRRTDKNPVRYSQYDFDICIACDIETNDCWMIPIQTFLEYKSGISLESEKMANYKNDWDFLCLG